MPVERDIDLNKPITEEDIIAMEEEANRLEALAQEAHENAESAEKLLDKEDKLLNDAVKKIEKLEKEAEKAEKAKNKIGRSIKEVNQLAQHRSALAGMGGEDPFAEGEQFGMGGMIPGAGQIQTGRTGFGTGQEQAPLGGLLGARDQFEARMLEEHKKAEEETKKLKEADKLAKKERAEHKKAIAENKKMVMDARAKFQEGLSFTRNPTGFAFGNLKGMVGKAGIVGLIAVIGLSVAEQVFDEVKKMYGPGGVFDIRKQMQDRDREMIELDNIVSRNAGRVFFTGDVELSQSAPEYSNTERLRDRMSRYQALHLGE